MHASVNRKSRERRRAGANITDSEDTEAEEGHEGEMDNFQDLQLGSMTPVVRREDFSPSSSLA
jgi:hypothetical protein